MGGGMLWCNRATHRVWLWGLLLCTLAHPRLPLAAQSAKTVPFSQRGIDLVAAEDGPAMFGIVLADGKRGPVRIAVQREWFRRERPEQFQEFEQREQAAQAAHRRQVLQHLEAWIQRREGAQNLISFLNAERQRLQKPAADLPAEEEPQFAVLEFETRNTRRVYVQPASRRQFALLALHSRFERVEDRSVDDLRAELLERKVDLRTVVDMRDRLGGTAWSDQDWAAEVALAEFQYLRPLEFQAFGESLIEGGDDERQVDLSGVLNQVLSGQLKDLLNADIGTAGRRPAKSADLIGKAAKRADELGLNGFRITRLELDTGSGQATVATQFVAKMPDGKWRPVWAFRARQASNEPADGQVDQIAADPTIKQALQIARQLGADESVIKRSLGFGAATQTALRSVNSEFFQFRDRNLKRLADGWMR